jgi:sulfate transport system ATP-binding protein
MNQAKIEQVGPPQEVYDRPATPFVYQFIGNVNVLRAPALAPAVTLGAPALVRDGHIYVRPHDIAISPFVAGAGGVEAEIRGIHAAGPQARLSLEQLPGREPIEVELSRSELVNLDLKLHDRVSLRLRRSHSFSDDYAI